MNFNYFSVLCFIWAFLGFSSRLAMLYMGEKWTSWELEKAYGEKKPKWIYAVSILSLMIIIYTWYMVFTTNVPYSWIISTLISFTLIKVFTLVFNYDEFRSFVMRILEDKRSFLLLNIIVITFSIACVIMGIFLY